MLLGLLCTWPGGCYRCCGCGGEAELQPARPAQPGRTELLQHGGALYHEGLAALLADVLHLTRENLNLSNLSVFQLKFSATRSWGRWKVSQLQLQLVAAASNQTTLFWMHFRLVGHTGPALHHRQAPRVPDNLSTPLWMFCKSFLILWFIY